MRRLACGAALLLLAFAGAQWLWPDPASYAREERLWIAPRWALRGTLALCASLTMLGLWPRGAHPARADGAATAPETPCPAP
ncbi:MAG: hypothetical protein R3F62_11065 [Planctomycetota bacterium]